MRLPNKYLACAVLAVALTACLLSACAVSQASPPTAEPVPTSIPTLLLTATQTSTPLPSPTNIPSPTPTSVPEKEDICSPLEGETLDMLASPDLLKNPFVSPRPGYDDGHPGMDLAFWSRPDGKPMLGLPIHSILSGTVVMQVDNRQPYGNAVMIETSLAQPATSWLKSLLTASPAQNLQPSYSLSCPDYSEYSYNNPNQSLYVLYAHMDQTPAVKSGDAVACSQPIGEVGTTGRSVNPHLHLEIRIGPAGMHFASMAHYDPSATQEELRAYCIWRVSGAFVPIDPLPFILQASQAN